ncbi:class C sortase [Jeotgalibaca caeni]|uniref:class C sortase n=1 Tax=Jeotgalibaca caeni TaxID=3028623 RepID=UPI00237ECB6D|nr:class C sortase [Jeotgalibaca caeni]MDE1549521.1 class C sortase [Jeotgalibaca caeni]
MKQKKSKNRQKLFIGFVFLLGLGIFLFPNLSNLYSQYSHAMIILSYQKNQEETDDQLKELELERFQAYNESLSDAGKDYVDPFAENEAEPINRSPEVDERLGDPLGHIEVPKIGIDIPIYDGTTDYILQRGIGLLGNSSMPVGGVGTHAALTGHRGLPNAELFSNIVDLVEGDLFYIHSAGGILAYQVQTIKTVLPHETESLKIQAGKDLVTLITCTPYMVNSHRLLITGIRIPYVAPPQESPLTTQKIMKKVAENHSYLGVYLASIFVLVSMVFFYIHRRKKRGEGHE